ncbi:MAG: capsule assembly Wzi family protein [Gemmatimonadaceae bacterium]
MDSLRFAAPLASRDAVQCTAIASDHSAKAPPAPRIALRAVWPSLMLSVADGIPDSRADGALWAGRGLSALVRGGVTVDAGALHLAFAPEVWAAHNRPYDLLASDAISGTGNRSPLASPFYYGAHSLDLPSRLGVSPLATASLGQSALWLTLHGVDIGAATSNVWWGPGLRDGLLLGPGAAGIPRAFVRTSRPVETRVGRWQGEWFIGTLTESRWFDTDPTNDRRTVSAARVEWSPPHINGLVVGVYRAVQRPQQAKYPTAGFSDLFRSATVTHTDQLAGLFASYATPTLRAYAEIVTPNPPAGIRALLSAPGDTRGYQFGVERRIARGPVVWLLHADLANTDPGISIRDRPPHDFYTGSNTPQGWTQRGQLLGAGIGPGGTSQWLSVDRLSARYRVGGYVERVRWNNEVLTRLYLPTIFRHDVTVRGGVRGGVRATLGGHGYDIGAELSIGTRLNYLFQNTTWIRDYRTVDVPVSQFRITLSPDARRSDARRPPERAR